MGELDLYVVLSLYSIYPSVTDGYDWSSFSARSVASLTVDRYFFMAAASWP